MDTPSEKGGDQNCRRVVLYVCSPPLSEPSENYLSNSLSMKHSIVEVELCLIDPKRPLPHRPQEAP